MMSNQPITPDNTLIVVALEDELPTHMVPGWNVLYTGVGKVNAAIAATEAVLEAQPTHLINYGTAGALNTQITGLNRVNHIVQRDMDVRPLGFELGHTPFDTTGHIDLGGSGVSLGTGDHFVTTPPELITDIVDMEAYALAKVARLYQIHFQCWKYISDNANDDAADHWAENVAKGARAFVEQVIRPLEN
jgi:adenosylhomocysteine nucleosidase